MLHLTQKSISILVDRNCDSPIDYNRNLCCMSC